MFFKNKKRKRPEEVHDCPSLTQEKKINGIAQFTKMGLSRSEETSPPIPLLGAATGRHARVLRFDF